LPRYAAFLRAINVGGRVVKMDRLRQLVAGMGLANVETFIASGNLVFESPIRTQAKLEALIEAGLVEALQYRVATFVRSLDELAAVASSSPSDDGDGTLYIGFLRATPQPAAAQAVRALSTETDRLDVKGREIYWLCRTRLSDSRVSGAALEKLVRDDATFRNITTVKRMAARWCSGSP
jgi:uncharacterized protein (DUF1697 family)